MMVAPNNNSDLEYKYLKETNDVPLLYAWHHYNCG